jgi:putative tryptophan/tyrosine transport system substrate-binding protein
VRRREFIAGLAGAATSAGLPLLARAQQAALSVVGYLGATSASAYAHLNLAFSQGLNEAGFVEGQNVAIEYRWADGQYERLPAMAAELVARRVAVIAAVGGVPAALAAKAATSTIPIVFSVAGDPVKLGLVGGLARPNGNATGAAFLSVELEQKRLELLHELMPKAALIAVLLNPSNPQSEIQLQEMKDAALVLGHELRVLNASTEPEIDRAFATIVQQRANALIVAADIFLFSSRDQVLGLAASSALPAIYPYRELSTSGGLMSYGTNLADAYHLEGNYVGRILKGATPADLPVQQSTKVEFVINLKTAKTLGLTFPITLLGRADEVIE